MDMDEREAASRTGEHCLSEGIAALPAAGSIERRHEQVMEWAVAGGSAAGGSLDRAYAERVVLLAEEEALEPVYALLLVRCGIGVRELEPPGEENDDLATQPTAPDWVEPGTVGLDIALERRLRASFRRFRARLEASETAEAAVRAFLAEPDVGPVSLR